MSLSLGRFSWLFRFPRNDSLNFFFPGGKGLVTSMQRTFGTYLWNCLPTLSYVLHLGLDSLSFTFFKINLKFLSERKRPGESASLAVRLPALVSPVRRGASSCWAVRISALYIWFLLGFPYCWFRIQRFSDLLSHCYLFICSSTWKIVGCSYVFYSPSLRFSIILLSFQWCFGRVSI